MNWKELPPDDWHSETESAEEREQLSGVERRLKAARPSRIELDAVAWERIVSASESSAKSEETTAATTGRGHSLGRRWLNRAVGTIAAAWLSGVVVGSGAMFLMMDRDAVITQTENRETPVDLAQRSSDDPSAPVIRPQTEQRARDITLDKPTPETASSDSMASSPNRDEEKKPAVVMVDSRREVRAMSWLDATGPWTPLRPFDYESFIASAPTVHPSPWRSSSLIAHEERLQQSESQRELSRSFVPPPGATPRRILEELRMEGETPGRTL